MNSVSGVPGGRSSRRQLLRLAGGGIGLALLGAGAVGCENDAASAKPEDRKPSGTDAASPADGEAPAPLWSQTTSAQAFGGDDALVVAGGVVIAVGDPLVGRDAATGKERWSIDDGAVPGAPLLLADGTLYLASGQYDGTVAGLDPATGKETWRSRLGKEYAQPRPIAVDGAQVYVVAEILEDGLGTRTNVIAALNSTTGKVVWKEQRDVGTEEHGITAAVQGNLLVYTDFRKNLTVRDTATGKQVWTQKITESNFRRFAVEPDVVVLAQGRELQAFELKDGTERWSLRTEEFTTFKGPSVIDGVLYVADSDETLWAVQPATGKTIWQAKDLADTGGQAPWQFAKGGGTLYGATEFDEGGGIHAFDAKTGALRWTFNDKSGDVEEWHVAASDKQVVALHGGKLHALPAV
jgi:outer membrane protein assembly factor BamB